MVHFLNLQRLRVSHRFCWRCAIAMAFAGILAGCGVIKPSTTDDPIAGPALRWVGHIAETGEWFSRPLILGF